MEKEEIKEICEMHGIEPEGAELFNDDYIISKTGDLICGRNWGYSVWDNMLLSVEWFSHLRQKIWYKDRTFVPAYIEALCRQNIDHCEVGTGFGTIILEPFVLRADKKKMENLITTLEELTRKWEKIYSER